MTIKQSAAAVTSSLADPVSLIRVRRAIIALGAALLGVIWGMYADVLAPYQLGSAELLFNVLVSLVIVLFILWVLRLLNRQQMAVEAVQLSQKENQQLIARLEEAHERSSRA